MIKLLARLGINAIALWAAIELVPGLNYEGTGTYLLIIAVIFGLLNALVRPLLILLTCPLVFLTFGLFIMVINTIMLSITIWLSGPDVLGLGLYSTGLWPTFFGALIISLVSGVINALIADDNEEEKIREN